MPLGNDNSGIDRRKMLKVLGAGGAVGLAGCTGGGGDGGEDTTTTAADTTTTTTAMQETTTTTAMQETTTTTEQQDTTTTTEEQGPRQVGGRFVQGSTSTAGAPHPLRVSDTTTGERLNKLYDYPGGTLGPQTFRPRLWGNWEMNDSFDEVTYTVRDGLKFGAGYGQLTAEDFVYLLKNIILLEGDEDWFGFTDTQFYKIGPKPQEFITYEKTGKMTFKASLPVSKPQWLHEDPLMFQVPLPKDLLKPYVQNQDRKGLDNDKDIVEGKLSQGEANLGPYKFVEWERGSLWQFERNDNYYLKEAAPDDPAYADPYYDFRNSPYFNEFRYQQFSEESTMLSALKTGEIDSAGIPEAKVSQYRGRDDITLWESKFDNGVFWLNLNHRINSWEPLRNSRKVRQAMAELWNPETIVQDINNGNAVPLSTFHPRWGPFYPPSDQLYEPQGSIDKAKTLLEEGTSSEYGYDDRGRFIGPDGSQVTLKSVRATGSQTTETSAQHMKSRLSEAGIKLDIAAAQWQTLLRNYAMNSVDNVEGVSKDDLPDWAPVGLFNGGPWNQSTSAKPWSLMFGLGFSTSPYAPWSAIKSTMAEQGTFNLWGYHQNEFDIVETINQASTAPNPQVTQQKLTELFAFLSRDMPVVWTLSQYIVEGYRNNVTHFPGEKTEDGYRATSFFKSPEPARLMSLKQQ